ncbi:MAG: ribose ABC transporter permease, partial [Gemmatimonadaceae bacterium]|nr:ribose ABC transporter permease [Gemmatimonadaceae bacterium]
LDVIAAIVIGGVSLLGGVGRVIGTLLGVVLMQVVRSGMIFLGVESNWQNVVVGSLLLIAVAVDVTQRRRGALA